MKKFFTLFAAAVVGLSAFAQDAAPKVIFEPVETEDASKTTVTIKVENSRDDLNAISLGMLPAENAQFIKIMNEDEDEFYWWPNGLYVLGNYPGKSDTWKTNKVRSNADIKESVKNGGELVIIALLSDENCRTFPAENGTLGTFTMDLSALPDGEKVKAFELDKDKGNTNFALLNGSSIYPEDTAEGYPEVFVKKEGNKISPVTAINVVDAVKNVTSVKYYNIAGVESATPFQGVNIMVQTYDDGTKSATKVVK